MLTTRAVLPVTLEVRANSDGSRSIRGRFPYNSTAVLSDGGRNGGRPIKERFLPGAFAYRVNDPEAEIHFLLGHDYSKPLASRKAGSLDIEDGNEALTFDARILPEIADTSYGRDALAMLSAGLAVGLSPGFRIPPQRTVPDAETITDEDPREGDARIRSIKAALLYELSLVTRPVYEDSGVELRARQEQTRAAAVAAAAWRYR